jgi:hypothetical protein
MTWSGWSSDVDVAYFVRRGEQNPELRHSLRTLVNLPHDRVWIIGHKPDWVTGVEHVPGNRWGGKWRNVWGNVGLVAEHLTGEFVMMNDDFFILEPVESPPDRHRGRLVDHIGSVKPGPWRDSLEATLRWLTQHGIDDPLSYELHCPVVMDAGKLGEVLTLVGERLVQPQWRTLYGNWWQVSSTVTPDCRVRGTTDVVVGPFLSTDSATWRRHLAAIAVRAQFAAPCRYEAR